MLQGLAKSICVNAKKTSAVDNTPNAVNWGNVAATALKKGGTSYTYSAQQITGISTSITLRVVFSDITQDVWYKIQSTSTVPSAGTAPQQEYYSSASHNSTITVSNNEYLVFGPGGTSTITVNNTSDGNTTLDTFTTTS